MPETKYKCGEIYRDREGVISQCQDSVYVLISRDFVKEVHNCDIWTVVRMSVWMSNDTVWADSNEEDVWMGWPGGQIATLYEVDIDRLEFIGVLPFEKEKEFVNG